MFLISHFLDCMNEAFLYTAEKAVENLSVQYPCAYRIEKLDFLDEKELLVQLLQHYCLSCGYSDAMKIGETHALGTDRHGYT